MIPTIFEPSALKHHLQRAHKNGYADFLLENMTDDLLERLTPILREFEKAIDIGTPSPFTFKALEKLQRFKSGIRIPPIQEEDSEFFADENTILPSTLGHFNLAFSLLALQAVNDLPGALIKIRQLLKPDGLFIGCLLGGETLTELRQSFVLAETEIEDGTSPRVAPFADVRSLGDLMSRAGFTLPVTDVDRVMVRYPDAFTLMADLRAMGATNALANRRKTFLKRTTLLRMAEIYQTDFADEDGRVRATFEFVWIMGWAPDASQPKPLRPGQFNVDFSDAIKAANKSNDT